MQRLAIELTFQCCKSFFLGSTMSIGSHRSSHVWPSPRSHVRTRLAPQKPRKLSRARKVFPPPFPRSHVPQKAKPAWSHKSPENFFRGPESFSTTLRRSHVRTRLVPQKPRISGAGKVFPPPRLVPQKPRELLGPDKP